MPNQEITSGEFRGRIRHTDLSQFRLYPVKTMDARSKQELRERNQLLACDMQDRVGVISSFLQRLDSSGCRQYVQFDFPAMRFTLYLVHDRQGAGASTDHETLALPGYVFLRLRAVCVQRCRGTFWMAFYCACGCAPGRSRHHARRSYHQCESNQRKILRSARERVYS